MASKRFRNSGEKVRSSAASALWLVSTEPKPTARLPASLAPALVVMIKMTLRKSAFLPVLSVIETPRPLPQSISQPIFSAAGGGLAGAMSAPKEKVE